MKPGMKRQTGRAGMEIVEIVEAGDASEPAHDTRRDTLWRYDDVAHYLAVSVKTVARRVKAGDLPSIPIGRARRFDPDAIRAYARRRMSSEADAL